MVEPIKWLENATDAQTKKRGILIRKLANKNAIKPINRCPP